MTDEIERNRMTENDLARRRRVGALTQQIGMGLAAVVDSVRLLREDLEMPSDEALRLGIGTLVHPEMREAASALLDDSVTGGRFRLPIEAVIDRLFAEAARENQAAPGQAPAMECLVTLSAGGTLQGTLSVTPDRLYRMLTPSEPGMFLEHFFDAGEVTMVSLKRKVTATIVPRIFPAS
jgi:hypothetical protein